MTLILERFALWLLSRCGWHRFNVNKGEVLVAKCHAEGEAIMVKSATVQAFPPRTGSAGKGQPGA